MGWNEVTLLKGLMKILDEDWKLSEKNEANDSTKDGLGIVIGSVVVYLRCIKEEMWVGD